jgi:hypothetical protein
MAELGTGCAPVGACCGTGTMACIFAKALMAQAGRCERAVRAAQGEHLAIDCDSPVAQANCHTLAALLRERSRFALKLPGPDKPLLHQQAMRLQCAGLAAIRASLAPAELDVHRLVALAQRTCGGLMDLPWQDIVPAMQAWEPRRRRSTQDREAP